MSDLPEIHFFICVNKKGPEKSSCAYQSTTDPSVFKDKLKLYCKERWGKKVRVNNAGCLGQCSKGVAAVIYPQGKWYLKLDENDFQLIIKDIENFICKL